MLCVFVFSGSHMGPPIRFLWGLSVAQLIALRWATQPPALALLYIPLVTSGSHSCKTGQAATTSLPDIAPVSKLILLKKVEFLFLQRGQEERNAPPATGHIRPGTCCGMGRHIWCVSLTFIFAIWVTFQTIPRRLREGNPT